MNRSRELARILLDKAAQDEFTVGKLVPDPESPDEVIGFHAQQAVEKMLKAVLSHKGGEYRRTHDLAELLDLIRGNGIPLSDELDEVKRLAPFAVELRYDYLPEGGAPHLDREWVLVAVKETRRWAEGIVQSR